jgi:2-polyprenyl-3-methyl-5-hydroxy-6-metoxy-1,4-benzoquinol methylase
MTTSPPPHELPSVTDPWGRIRELIESKAAHGITAEAFQLKVNITFHRHESRAYDDVHEETWIDLDREFTRVTRTVVPHLQAAPKSLHLLDIGCGTGLATEMLLRSAVGPLVGRVTLLDTSAAMLGRAARRARAWQVSTELREETLERLRESGGGPFDLVVTCSVLHHIPDLSSFLSALSDVQPVGGVFLHLHDPNCGVLCSEVVAAREAEARRAEAEIRSGVLNRIRRGIVRRVDRLMGRNYLERTNRDLLDQGVIHTPLTDEEIWSVTDIRDHAAGEISPGTIGGWLKGYAVIANFTYAYFGRMRSRLPRRLQERDISLEALGDPHGTKLMMAWQKRGDICLKRRSDTAAS